MSLKKCHIILILPLFLMCRSISNFKLDDGKQSNNLTSKELSCMKLSQVNWQKMRDSIVSRSTITYSTNLNSLMTTLNFNIIQSDSSLYEGFPEKCFVYKYTFQNNNQSLMDCSFISSRSYEVFKMINGENDVHCFVVGDRLYSFFLFKLAAKALNKDDIYGYRKYFVLESKWRD